MENSKIFGIEDIPNVNTVYSFNFEKQIFSKGVHSFILNKDGKCYVWGSNNYNQLAIDTTQPLQHPCAFSLPNNEKILTIACGEYHSICISINYLCYVWGGNSFGQLGLGDTNTRSTLTLLTLPNNERISFITCGSSHTICLTENKLCYVWGANYRGQLGLGDTATHLTPTLLTLPKNENISFITCGSNNTICITEKGMIYVWGHNYYGDLGLGHRENCLSPTLFSLPNNERISFITCGYFHTICLTENNLCYVWGFNEYGQLGLGDTNNRLTPALLTLPNNERIYFIACSSTHTICLTENNLCYVWGFNDGELGLGDNNDRLTPTLLTLPNNERISFVTCGSSHTICLTENNLCYVWGFNLYGQLGLGDTTTRSSPALLNLPN